MAHKSISQLDAFEFSAREVTPVPGRAVTADLEAEPGAGNLSHSGSTSSAADLALDLVLSEMLQQARLASSATGAAVGLLHGSQIVCRAAAGATATEIAAYLAMDCKIVDVGLRSGNAQRSDDTEIDPRFNAAACKRLGLRSVVVVPVRNKDEKSVGVVEIFSSRPSAFSDRDVLMLEGIGHRVLHNMEIAQQVMAGSVVPAAAPAVTPSDRGRPIAEFSQRIRVPDSLRFWTRPLWGLPKPGFDSKLFLLLAAIALSLTLGWMLGRVHGGIKRRVAPRSAAATQRVEVSDANAQQKARTDAGVAPPAAASPLQAALNAQNSSQAVTPAAEDNSLPGIIIARHALGKPKTSRPSAPVESAAADNDSAGSLVIFEDPTKEKAPSSAASGTRAVVEQASKSTPVRQSAATIRVSPAEAEKNLIQRIEPDYPPEARGQNLQGRVVLDIIVDKTGAVRGISKLSGDPQLALASARAVQQWQFKPLMRDGNPIQFETRVTLNFALR